MLSKSDPATGKKEPVVIKKYANRRLYNTETSTYVTLEDLAQMVRSERDFVVFDARTGDDLTHSVLTQIIVEQESRAGQTLLPVPFLRQLIRFYGGAMERMVPSYLQVSLETLTREQDRFRKQFANAFTPQGALEAYQEQARKNLQLFEQAMAMFSPFGATGKPGAKPEEGPAKSESPEPSVPRDKPAAAKPAASPDGQPESDELAAMRNELAAMQARIEKLAKTKT
ncbi:MAG: polyhydroxyalkanoate synthesis repressor PhaR [Hyphomicrobium sp.]|nr:polyhydroxyalkanoate synthesis repressor PhaR [Hyphomicrobium sp.]